VCLYRRFTSEVNPAVRAFPVGNLIPNGRTIQVKGYLLFCGTFWSERQTLAKKEWSKLLVLVVLGLRNDVAAARRFQWVRPLKEALIEKGTQVTPVRAAALWSRALDNLPETGKSYC